VCVPQTEISRVCATNSSCVMMTPLVEPVNKTASNA
jgi:hypothetical protein